MSTNRNKRLDRDKTKEVIESFEPQLSSNDLENWLGHQLSKKCSTLDAMLLNGATMSELKKVRGAIREHFHHLEEHHGLKVSQNGDVFRIDRVNLGIPE